MMYHLRRFGKKLLKRGTLLAVCMALSASLPSCFTGVESTPKITLKEVKKQTLSDNDTEKSFLADVSPKKPSEWTAGKAFYITDNRLARIAASIEPYNQSDSLAGRIIFLSGVDTVATLTDSHGEIELQFTGKPEIDRLVLRTSMSPDQWQKAMSYTLPFMVDVDLVNVVRDKLRGKDFYILTRRRLDSNDNDTIASRYEPVTITDVTAGTESTPFKVFFTDKDGNNASVLMTVNAQPTGRRFESLFSEDNPRNRYKTITDENWELIKNGKIAE